ncbi:hypothetical protein EKI60_02820 [Candidatus Saccharibacteria bacterium]|nr:MAG: hypothetical protein EKI60_02820 [Candidatus Saccharibacteria bacterium]
MSRGRGLIAAGALGLNAIVAGAAVSAWPGESDITFNKGGNIETTVTPGFVQDDIAVRDTEKDLNGDGIKGDVTRQDNEISDFAKVIGLGVASDVLLAAGVVMLGREED